MLTDPVPRTLAGPWVHVHVWYRPVPVVWRTDPVVAVSKTQYKLESSRSPHTSAKAMLFARWQHHLRFCSGFPYAPLKAMVTKISKWSKIKDSFRITHKIKPLVVCAIPDIPSKFPSITFWVILLTYRQINRRTKSGKNITSLAKVKRDTKLWSTSLLNNDWFSRFLPLSAWTAPQYLADHISPAAKVASLHRLRSANRHRLIVPRCRLNTYGHPKAFPVAGPKVWNSLPDELREIRFVILQFQTILHNNLFSLY